MIHSLKKNPYLCDMASKVSAPKSISSTIELISAVQSETQQAYNCLLETAKSVSEEENFLRAQLPYQINVIDELHINENAHSRILSKLLQYYNSEGRYIILESLVEFIKKRSPSDEFDGIIILSPNVTQEKGRIDLWVRDYKSKYALIFENKINDAKDQGEQLYRYIEKTRHCRFADKRIFIFYLTKFGYEPSRQTWGNKKTYNDFRNRFMALSFRHDILYWLKFYVLPNISQKDDYLSSAVIQYVDYLEGLFNIRQNNQSLNMNLERIIAEKLGFSSISESNEKYKRIIETIEDINSLRDSLEEMKEQTYKDCLRQNAEHWRASYKVPSKRFQIYDYEEWDETILFGVKFDCDGKPTHVEIGMNDYGLFCQVQRDIRIKKERISKKTLSIFTLAKQYLDENDSQNIFDYFDRDFDAVYSTFCNLVQAIDKYLSKKGEV